MAGRSWIVALIACTAVHAGGRAAGADSVVHVLEDQFTNERRTLTFVIERGGDCVGSGELATEAPFRVIEATVCTMTIEGPLDVQPGVVIGGKVLPIESTPTTMAPLSVAPLLSPASTGDPLTLSVEPARALPVGPVALAARLAVTEHGRPTDEIAINIRAVGARVRALRWEGPGLAAVDVQVDAWSPSVELVVVTEDGNEQRVVIPVDPGPPHGVDLDASRARVGEPFSVTVQVTTRAGANVPNDRVRVASPDCAHRGEGLVCTRAGVKTLVIRVNHGGTWVPIAHSSVFVIAPVVTETPASARPAATRGGAATWGGALSGSAFFGGTRHISVAVRLDPKVSDRLRGSIGAGVHLSRRHLDPLAPVIDELSVGEQSLELDAGVALRDRELPWELRVAAGPALSRQQATLASREATSFGLRVRGTVTAGIVARIGARRFGLALGLGHSIDVIAPTWNTAGSELFLELNL